MARKNHGGNLVSLSKKTGFAREDILDFSANINPLGFPECVRSVVAHHLRDIAHYPDPDCSVLADTFCKRWGVAANEILFGNGSEEVLYLLPRVAKKPTALIPVPSYSDYITACELSNISIKTFILNEHDGFILDFDRLESELSGNEIVFLGNPANPTGFTIDTERFCQLAIRKPETVFVVDEAFADFVEGLPRLISSRPDNIIVTGSFTKFYAVPGLRLGYVAASPHYIKELNRIVPPWSVNALAQVVGEAVLSDTGFENVTRRFVNQQRIYLSKKLGDFSNLTVYPGKANYFLVRIDDDGIDAPALAERLLRYRIAIRVCDTFVGLDKRFFRIAIRTEAENDLLINALASVFKTIETQSLPPGAAIGKQKKKPSVMFQGTGSNAGKSILTAALCRVLFQDGYAVAPFKSQNMSLNSFVTCGGGEMGRAQVVQAQACRIPPDVRMNPILLKPNSDTGSQVIVLGNSIGNMDVGAYVRYKPEAFGHAKKAYDELATEFDVMSLKERESRRGQSQKPRYCQHGHGPLRCLKSSSRRRH
jgi:L-threonine-O-3-phosphate decarboxylase